MISISDELKVMVDDYNKKHMFKKLHISEICQEAIYLAVTGEACSNVPVNHELKMKSVVDKQIIKDDSDKPVIPCPICGEEFVQTKPTRKYCSKNCGTTASKRRNKAE
jgi:hypothetical protein